MIQYIPVHIIYGQMAKIKSNKKSLFAITGSCGLMSQNSNSGALDFFQ